MTSRRRRSDSAPPHPSDGRSPAAREKTRRKKLLFAAEIIASETFNATDAARKVGYAESRARQEGSRLLADPEVQAEIARLNAARAERLQITADLVLERLWMIATADPREIVEYRRTCCRYCHGTDFRYQHTTQEIARKRTAWEAVQTKNSVAVFDEEGGIGYNGTLPPNPKCPECFGEGVERVYVHDTRRLSRSALCLYAGVKQTKDGLEAKLHDQHAALVNVGRHFGMFDPKAPSSAETDEDRAAKLRATLDAMDAATIGTTPQPEVAA